LKTDSAHDVAYIVDDDNICFAVLPYKRFEQLVEAAKEWAELNSIADEFAPV